MKFKSKSLISIILSIMMVISMILVAIPANAAVVDGVSVGAGGPYYLWYTIGDNLSGSNFRNCVPMSDDGTNYVATISNLKKDDFLCFFISTGSTFETKYNGIWSTAPSSKNDDTTNFAFVDAGTGYTFTDGGNNYYFVKTKLKNAINVKVTYNSNNVKISKDDGTTTTEPTDPTEPTTTPTPTTQYYIGGRFRVKNSSGVFEHTYGNNTSIPWKADSTTGFELKDEDGDGTYSLNTNCTIAELSANLPEKVTSNYDPFFFIHTGSGVGTGNVWYGKTSAVLNDTTTSIKLDDKTDQNTDSANGLVKFSSSSSSTDKIVLNYTPSTKTLFYTTEGGTTTGDYKLNDKSGNFGKVVFTVNGQPATSANEGDEVTATVTPNGGFDYVADTFSVTNDTTSAAVGTISGTSLTFKMPASDVTATASFKLNKAEYVKTLDNGLYVDVAPDKNDTTATFVMWNNYTGVGQNAPSSGYAAHTTKDYYTLYIPANVDLSSVTLYNAYSTAVKINGYTVPADGRAIVSLTETTYNVDDNNTFKVQVLKGSTSSMFLYTNDGNGNDYDLPTSKKSYSGLLDKETIKASGGLCTTVSGTTVSDALDLSQVKGRGNSSWQASCQLFGKYAFNMKLSSATSLFGLPKSKSFCLLANNMDDTMMRNAYIYQLAKDIGLYDSPEFEFVDIYDNGEYMGAYLVTEKVDVADKNKLIQGNSIDDLNSDAGAKFDEDNPVHSDTLGYANITNGVDLDGNTDFVNSYQTTGTYLLEFEIPDRVKNEPSYFKSTQGQNVVLKSPEFATQGEVEFIRDKFNAMESLVYADTIDLEALSKVMDLDSFARMYLIQEFTSNLDSAATSYYITYDCSKGLFVASPVWDYDMALGQNSGNKKDVSGNDISSGNTTAWFAKVKAMGDGTQYGSYSLQSKLANDPKFQTVIKKVWNGKNNDGFYAKVKEYYKSGGYLDTWRDQISKSVNMNETRWGFIANNPARKAWGSSDTTGGKGFAGAVSYLKSNWSSTRADWLNTQFTSYTDYTQIATPTLTAYNADAKTPLEGEVPAGGSYVLKATTSEIYVDYVLYEGKKQVATKSDGVFEIKNAEPGTHSYTVKTVYNSANEMTSEEATVTVSAAPADIEGVTITSSKTEVNVNEEFTLTATASPVGVTGVTYTFYKDGVEIAKDVTSNTYKTKLTDEGSANYTVKATANGITVESTTPVTVTATKVALVHDFTVYFKCASAPAYKPYVSLDGAKPVTMTQGTELGKNYAGTLTFYWYSYTFEVDSADTHTLTFTSKKTKLNATMTDNFANSEYYLAVDNLMSGTEVVDLSIYSGSLAYIRNFFHSATNMVYSGVGTDRTLGFTNIDGERHKMGEFVNPDGTSTFSIKSATVMQMLTAELTTVSETQKALLDVNLDGKVDVKDATLMQRALVS